MIVSADISTGARERALAAGAVGFISKPIDDDFEEQVDAYLNGKVEILEDAEKHLQAYQQELVERLEGNIRQLSNTVEKNKHLLQQNERMFSMLERRHKLLETAARVGQMVTSILDLDDLLKHTVNIICSEFNFIIQVSFWSLRMGNGLSCARDMRWLDEKCWLKIIACMWMINP